MMWIAEEIQAVLGAILALEDEPFVFTSKVPLTPDEAVRLATLHDHLRASRRRLGPDGPGQAAWLAMLQRTGEVQLDVEERSLLARIVAVCLSEFKADGDLGVHAGPGIRLEALRLVQSKLGQSES